MNLNSLRFFFISSVLLVTKDISCGSSKQISERDNKLLNEGFANLFKLLANIHKERSEVLQKLFNLYDVTGVKPALRTAQHRKDDMKPKLVAIVIHKRNDYPKTRTAFGNKRCVCDDRDPDINVTFPNDFKERAVARANSVKNVKVNKKTLSYYNDSTSSSGETFATAKPGQTPRLKSSWCISPRRGYEECKSSCKDAYKNACAEHYCSERLYRKLRKECKYYCKERFRQYDYDYY